jgi:hypothetical protein
MTQVIRVGEINLIDKIKKIKIKQYSSNHHL